MENAIGCRDDKTTTRVKTLQGDVISKQMLLLRRPRYQRQAKFTQHLTID